MFRAVPTYKVSFIVEFPEDNDPENVDRYINLGVPEDELESLLHILVFNNCCEFHVEKEETWPTSLFTQTESLSSEDTSQS